jgi:hypothetical protein
MRPSALAMKYLLATAAVLALTIAGRRRRYTRAADQARPRPPDGSEFRHLAQADRHVAEAKKHVARQRLGIHGLTRAGHPIDEAHATLAILERSLRIFEHHRSLIIHSLLDSVSGLPPRGWAQRGHRADLFNCALTAGRGVIPLQALVA